MKDTNLTNIPGIAVVGSGYWGKNLVRNYHSLGALKVICDKNEMILAQFKEQYPDVETCLAFSDLLSRKDIQGIVVATPAETHYTLAREALLSGKHVYVEKPLVLHEEEGRDLIKIAETNNRVLMVGHLLQYHPVFVELKALAAGGDLGRINYVYSNRLNLGKIRREENILWSFALHDISMILSLAGELPDSVFATGGNYLHKRIADVTTTHLEFPSGLKAHIFVSWLHPFKEQKLVVVGDKKMAVFDDTQPWEDKLLIYPHQINWQNNMPVPEKADPERVDIPRDEPLKLECRHFLECMANGKHPLTDGREGLNVLNVLNAAQRSLDAPVKTSVFSSQTPALQPQTQPNAVSTPSSSEPLFYPDAFIHETSIVDENCEIGDGTKIWHFSHVLSGSRIGKSCNIGQNVVIGPDVSIGQQCKIQNNVSVYKGVPLEDGVFCGPSMVFTNIYNPRAKIRKMDQVRPTLVKKGATLGANATIVCGTTLGRYCFIGAGAVVNKNIPYHALVVGNPGRQIGWVCKCGERLVRKSEVGDQRSDFETLECTLCGKLYEKCDSGIKERKR